MAARELSTMSSRADCGAVDSIGAGAGEALFLPLLPLLLPMWASLILFPEQVASAGIAVGTVPDIAVDTVVGTVPGGAFDTVLGTAVGTEKHQMSLLRAGAALLVLF